MKYLDLKKALLSLALTSSVLVQLSMPQSGNAKTQDVLNSAPTKHLISGIFSIRGRMEKDHRIRLHEEAYRGDPRVHAYIVTSSQALPYTISLGWLRVTDSVIPTQIKKKKNKLVKLKIKIPFKRKKEVLETISKKDKKLLHPDRKQNIGLNVVDENNFIIPALTQSPLESSRKVDIVAMSGFDAIIETRMNKAEKLYQDAIKMDPESEKLHNNYGVLLALKGDYSTATQHIDRAIKLNPKYASAITNRALLELAIGAVKAALSDANSALSLAPDSHPARIAKARALLESGEKEKALELAKQLKQQYSSDWQTMMLLADSELGNEQFNQAKNTLARLAVLSPNNSDLLIKLAHAEESIGDLDSAIKHARKATIVGGNDPKTHIALAQYLKSNRDFNAAALQLERAIELKPTRALRKRAMGELLSILVQQKKVQEAYLKSTKWAKAYSKDDFCQFNKAWIASKLGGTEYRDIAIQAYQEALRLNPRETSTRYNLALLLIDANQYKQATVQLEKFIKESEQDSDLDHAKELLEKLTKKS